MTEPRIQYAKTSDGVNIAYWTLGEGMPFVSMPGQLSHIQMEWQAPTGRRWFEALAQTARKKMLVKYDRRGSGLSARDVADYSLDAQSSDLAAVVDRLGLERFALYAAQHAGPVAVAYAASHPDRVSHLVLWCSYARGSDFWRSPRAQAFRAIRETDWELFAESILDISTGVRLGEEERQAGTALIREAATPESHRAFMEATEGVDVTDLLPHVKSPTLVLHRREVALFGVDLARELASRIPDARLALLEGKSVLPPLEDTGSVLGAINEFLGEGKAVEEGSRPLEASALRTILFTDLVGHTEMMSRLGDERGREVLREHERITREVLKTHGGTEVKTMGDGFMASFGSVTKAVECAIGLQRAFAEREGEPLSVRVGLNAGEPIEEDGDLFGATVILASRIAGAADGGEILVANAVRELCTGKGFLFSDRGEFLAKGFEEPVRLYEVRWRDG